MDPLQSEEKNALEDEDVDVSSPSAFCCRSCCGRTHNENEGRARRLSSKYVTPPEEANMRKRHFSLGENNNLAQPLFENGSENYLRSRSESNRRVFSSMPKSAGKESKRKMCWAQFWKRNFAYLTIVNWLPAYSFKSSFLKDFVSGVTVGVMAVPQAMSYATVAGLPPIYGLYNAFIGMLPYPFFGTSPHLISGPTAVMSILVNGIIPTHPMEDISVVSNNQVCTNTGPGTGPDSLGCHVRIQMALTLSFIAGVIQILFGFCGLGFLTNLISEPIIIGFTTGSAFLIAGTQITHVFGISKCKTGQPCDLGLHVVDTVANIFSNITETRWQTLLYGIACLLVLYLFKYQLRRLVAKTRLAMVGNLGPLVVMLSSILIMAYTGGREALDPTHASNGNLNHTSNHTSHEKPRNDWGIAMVGSVCALDPNSTSVAHPQCLPSPHWSMTFSPIPISLLGLKALIGPAIAVVMIGYMESMSIAKTVARQESQSTGKEVRIDPSYELTALGFCNLACSFFRGYPVTGSFSRTAVNANSGAQSPIAALSASLVVGSSLLFLTPALQYTPKVALASIVLIAIVKLIKVKEAIFFLRVSVRDFVGFLLVFASTIFLGVEVALIIGIASSWILFLVHNNQAHAMVLGKVVAKESKWCRSSSALFSVENGGGESDVMFVDMVSQALDAVESTGLAPQDVRTIDHIVILRLYGDLSFSSAENFRSLIDEIYRAVRPHSFVIDCTNVNDVDSSGVHALEAISSDLKSKEVIFSLAALPKHTRHTLTKAARYNKRLKSGPNRWQTEVIGSTEYVQDMYNEEGLPALLMFKQVVTAMRWCARASVVKANEAVEDGRGDEEWGLANKRTMTGREMGGISKSLAQTLGNKVQLIEAPEY